MPKPGIKEHRLYLLKFAEFDPPLKGFLPSLILSMTLTLCQNPASMNKDFLPSQISQKSIHVGRDLYLLKFTDCDPPWKGFLPSDVHKIQSTSCKGCLTSQICKIEFTSERILTLTLSQTQHL
jgi:hypothetical protein